MTAAAEDDYPGREEEDAELTAALPRLVLALAIRRGRGDTNRANALLARREAEARYETAVLERFREGERSRLALAEWAKSAEAQEAAARARMLGLFDTVPPSSGPTPLAAGPTCPSTAPSTTTVGDPVSPVLAVARGAHRAGTRQDGPHARRAAGRWRRWCRWWGE